MLHRLKRDITNAELKDELSLRLNSFINVLLIVKLCLIEHGHVGSVSVENFEHFHAKNERFIMVENYITY